MSSYSYLVTFSNLFERKYFDEHLDEFFIRKPILSNDIIKHSNKFIHIKDSYSFKPYILLDKFPKVKITRKVRNGKVSRYYLIKAV